LKEPRFVASSLYLKKPARIMALLMVMTVCWLVYAALEDRIRKTLKATQATLPHQTGQPVQNPMARWVFQDFVGIHLLRVPGQGAFMLHLHDQPQRLRRLLGRSYVAWYS
jgi:transposase